MMTVLLLQYVSFAFAQQYIYIYIYIYRYIYRYISRSISISISIYIYQYIYIQVSNTQVSNLESLNGVLNTVVELIKDNQLVTSYEFYFHYKFVLYDKQSLPHSSGEFK